MEYTRNGERLEYKVELDGEPSDTPDTLDFRADNVRMDKTGVHAAISVRINDAVLLGSDVFNVERLDPRQRLANRVVKQLNGNGTPLLDANKMHHLMDEFCLNLWPELAKDSVAELLDISGEFTTPDFLVPPFVLGNGAGTIIYGEPGRGKSWLAMLIAQSLASGSQKIWNVAQERRCLFVNLERDEEGIKRRFRAVNRALGIDPNFKPLMINRKGWTLERVRTSIERSIKEFEIDLIVLDSISRAGMGLTNDEDANKIMDTMNGFGVSWLGIAHTPKGNTDTLFGSQMFYASADVVCVLKTQEKLDENKLGVSIQIDKANDIPKTHMPLHALKFDEYGVLDVDVAMQMEFPELSEFAMTNAEKIREFLAHNGQADAATIAQGTGVHRTTVSGILANSMEYMTVDTGGKTKVFKLDVTYNDPF